MKTISAAAAVLLAGLGLALVSCTNRGQPFQPVRPGTIDSTQVEGVEFGRWTRRDSPYYVMDHVLVPRNRTLTIDPGVIVIFVEKGLNLTVEGTLVATGKPDSLITFRPTAGAGVLTFPGDWGSLIFNGGSGTFDWVRIQYASTGIVATDSEITLHNGVIRDSQFDALHLTRTSLDLVDGTIASNGGNGMTLMECENPPYPVRIIHCNIGLNRFTGIRAVNSTVYAERSDIKNNGFLDADAEHLAGGVHFEGAPGFRLPEFRRCNIELNKPCDARNMMFDGLEVTADSVYWGITTTDEMNALSNLSDPGDPRPDNCTFDVRAICDSHDIPNVGTVAFCYWREEPWPNFPSSKAFRLRD